MFDKFKNLFKKEEKAKPIKEFIIDRFYSFDGNGDTIGIMTYQNKLLCYTLERPLKYNDIENVRDNPKTAINESCCIPAGEYFADFTLSPRFKINLYCLLGTAPRQGVRIHAGNTIADIEGCILLGNRIIKNVKHKGKTYNYFLESSKKTIDEFHKICQGEKIKLIIKDQNQQETYTKFKFE